MKKAFTQTNNFMTTNNKSGTFSKWMFALLVLGFASCTKNFETINTPWNGSPTPTLPQLYIGFVANLDATANTEMRDDNGWILPITQQGAVYTKSDYPWSSTTSIWTDFYHNLPNYYVCMNLISASQDSSIYTNFKAMLRTIKAYQTIKISNLYGDLPYSQAGLATTGTSAYKVPYDKQQDIYLSVLSDLTWAVNNLSDDPNQYSLGSSDYVLQNNIAQWVKFANSLRLRIALTMYDKDPADAAPIIADAMSKPLLSDWEADNVGLSQTNIPGIAFDARAYSFGGECRLRMGTTMWKMMSSTNALDGSGIFDPRCNIFFEPNNNTEWSPFPQNSDVSTNPENGDPYNTSIRDVNWADKNGNPPGTPNRYANFNYYWSRDGVIANSTGARPEIFMTAAEVHFLKAEVYALGVPGVTQDMNAAQTEYEAGVTASVNYWSNMAIQSSVWVVNKPTGLPNAGTITALLNNPIVKFDPTTALTQIYAQEWIDLFTEPWEAWTLLRRTGGQTPMDTDNAAFYQSTYGNYQRYIYPGSESQYNYDNWFAATGGNDLISTKIWITK
jgi:Starch-binding associating with outer membrane